jgi:hypothetical protein
MRFPFFLAVLLLIAAQNTFSQQLYTFSDKDTLRVGEVFTFSVVVENPGASRTGASPDTSFFSSVFELRDVRVFKTAANRDSIALSIQFFGTADTTLSNMPIRYMADGETTVLRTGIFPIIFEGTVGEAEDAEFRPLKPIFQFAMRWWPWLIVALLSISAVYLIYRWYRNRPDREPEAAPVPAEIPPFVNPIEVLETELISIKSDSELFSRDPKAYYLVLGDALRAYFENLYHIPALELTTRELARELSVQMVDSHLSQIVIGILREADMVKFAKYIPWPDEAEKSLTAGFLFLERAKTMDRHKVIKKRQEYDRKYYPDSVKSGKEEVAA